MFVVLNGHQHIEYIENRWQDQQSAFDWNSLLDMNFDLEISVIQFTISKSINYSHSVTSCGQAQLSIPARKKSKFYWWISSKNWTSYVNSKQDPMNKVMNHFEFSFLNFSNWFLSFFISLVLTITIMKYRTIIRIRKITCSTGTTFNRRIRWSNLSFTWNRNIEFQSNIC